MGSMLASQLSAALSVYAPSGSATSWVGRFVAFAFRLSLMWIQYCTTSLRITPDARDALLTFPTSVTSPVFDIRVLTFFPRKWVGFCEISSAAACNADHSVTQKVFELHCTVSFDPGDVVPARRVVVCLGQRRAVFL